MLLGLLFVLSPILIWLFVIRRYCIRNGMGYTPGAGWSTTIWIDWQEARELAKVRQDKAMLGWCRLYLVIQIILSPITILSMMAGL